MTYVGIFYEARLLADGKLHWSDGDVWARATPSLRASRSRSCEQSLAAEGIASKPREQSSSCSTDLVVGREDDDRSVSALPISHCNSHFDGDWGCASICRGTLTWKEDEDVPDEGVPVCILSSSRFTMTYVGIFYEARLLADGKLHWSDGDVWARATPSLRASRSRSCEQSLAAEGFASKPQEQSAAHPSAQGASSSKPQVLLSNPGPVDAHVRPEPLSEARFDGTIKYFRGSFGWVVSSHVQEQYGCAAFLHINDCCSGFEPRQGDAVTFMLAEDKKRGDPKAVRAHAPVVTNARDWFQKRDQKRERGLALQR